MILILLITPFVLLLIWHFATKKYVAWGVLNFYMGKKRSGKSTLLSKLAYENLIKGVPVYSTEYITFSILNKKTGETKDFETISFDPRHIYSYSFPSGSVILIDEVSLIWDNRNFKNMDSKVVEWFRYQGHFNCQVHMFSQSYDIDLKLRNLVDNFFIITKVGRVFSIATHMIRKPVVVHPVGDSPASIQDDFVEDPKLLKFLFGSKIYFIPKWVKLFDSFKLPDSYINSDPRSSLLPEDENEDGMSDPLYLNFDAN